MEQFDNMTIGDLRKLTTDYEKVRSELAYVKAKFPKAKEELEAEDFNLDEFLKKC